MKKTGEIAPRAGTVELVPGVDGTWAPVPAPRRAIAHPSLAWLRETFSPDRAWHYLSPDETFLIRTHLHWLVPLRTIAKAAVSMPLAIVLTLALNFLAPGIWWLQAALWAATFSHQAYLFYLVLSWRAEQVVVTDRRLIRISGVFTTNVDAVHLDQITDSTYRQSAVGHVLGYGSIRIESAGQTQSVEQLDFVPDPRAIYQATLP